MPSSDTYTPLPRSLIHLHRHLAAIIRQQLWLQVLIGMALGIGFGVLIGPTGGLLSEDTAELVGNWVALPGRLFLTAVQFVVVPLVVASVIRGIAAGESTQSLGAVGAYSVGFFLLTTLLAVVIGLAAADLIAPGQYLSGEMLQASTASATTPVAGPASLPTLREIPDVLVGLLPRDPLATFVSGSMLQIVMTAVIIGSALLLTPSDQRKPIMDLMASVQTVCMVIVGQVLRLAPLAVFGLLAQVSAKIGLAALLGLAVYVATVLIGLALLLAVYLLIVVLVGRRSPLDFIRAAGELMLLAFSTSSSAAVMPLSLSTAERKLNVRPAVARFVIPLGTTINMGGTALYQGVATLFLAQVFGVEIGLSDIVLIVVLATGAAIGSPGTPGVGIVILATILSSVGIPAEGIAIILGVDRVLDMARTTVNVTGDLVASVSVDRLIGDGLPWNIPGSGIAAEQAMPNKPDSAA